MVWAIPGREWPTPCYVSVVNLLTPAQIHRILKVVRGVDPEAKKKLNGLIGVIPPSTFHIDPSSPPSLENLAVMLEALGVELVAVPPAPVDEKLVHEISKALHFTSPLDRYHATNLALNAVNMVRVQENTYPSVPPRTEATMAGMLSDQDIEAAIASGRLVIRPYSPELLQPASLDVRIAGQLIHDDKKRHIVSTPYRGYVMQPDEFALASTDEYIEVPDDLAVRVEGKSTWGRHGLTVHVTAGFVDPGFKGNITLELKNLGHNPIRIPWRAPIAQLSFIPLSSPARRPYGSEGLGSHYQGQRGVTGAAY